MTKTIFVGNLPYSVDEDELRSLFESAGSVVSVRIAYDRTTQRPRGFAFVEMEGDEAYGRAIQAFSGYRFKGRDLVVNEARARETGVTSRR
jgi:cold-inducible RNA-binding protein